MIFVFDAEIEKKNALQRLPWNTLQLYNIQESNVKPFTNWLVHCLLM